MTEVFRLPVRRVRSNHAEVARVLGTSIVDGTLAPGTKLPGDAELLRHFGISRPVLREGLKTLAAKGLITSKARVGTLVDDRLRWNMFDSDVLKWHLEAGVDADFLRDLAEIRLAIEPLAASLAASRRTDADLKLMRACLSMVDSAGLQAHACAEADLSLHLAILKASGNRFAHSISAIVEAALRASFLASAPPSDADRARVLADFATVVTEIERGDMERSAKAMKAVIAHSFASFGGLASQSPRTDEDSDRS